MKKLIDRKSSSRTTSLCSSRWENFTEYEMEPIILKLLMGAFPAGKVTGFGRGSIAPDRNPIREIERTAEPGPIRPDQPYDNFTRNSYRQKRYNITFRYSMLLELADFLRIIRSAFWIIRSRRNLEVGFASFVIYMRIQDVTLLPSRLVVWKRKIPSFYVQGNGKKKKTHGGTENFEF